MDRIYVVVRGEKNVTRCRDSRYSGYTSGIPRARFAGDDWKRAVAADVGSFAESQKLAPRPIVFLEVIQGGA